MLSRLVKRAGALYATGSVLTATPIFVANLANSHKFVRQAWREDSPLELAVLVFTYTWVCSVKAFGAGVLWPVTLADYAERARHQPDSLRLYWTLDREFDFVKDNTVLKNVLKNRKRGEAR